jgi:hypothetical protein
VPARSPSLRENRSCASSTSARMVHVRRG